MDSKFTSTDKFTIDRFEEQYTVLINSATLESVSLPVSQLPADINPGDTLVFQNGAWHFDHAETSARSEKIFALFQKIKEKNL